MNALDILFVILAALATLRSLYRGMVRELAAITGLIIGIALASRHYRQVAAVLPWLGVEAAHLAAFALIIVTAYALFALTSYLLRGAFKLVVHDRLDRGLGAALGLGEAVLLSGAILMALIAFLPPGPEVVRHSRLAPRLYPVSDCVASFTPAELHRAYRVKKRVLGRAELRWVKQAAGAGR
jgi:membrane protein required for colicin V production